MYTTQIDIDLSGERIPTVVYAKQGDSASRFLDVGFVDNGTVFVIPTGTVARFRMRKPGGTYIYNPSTISENRVQVEFTEQCLAMDGTALAEIELSLNEEIITTSVFQVSIGQDVFKGIKVENLNEFQVLSNLIRDVETTLPVVEEATNRANAVADEVQRKLDNGDFIGPQGPIGPIGPQGPQGERGAEGAAVITQLAPGMFALSVNSDGHLILAHNDNEPAPPLKITEDGRLIYTIL